MGRRNTIIMKHKPIKRLIFQWESLLQRNKDQAGCVQNTAGGDSAPARSPTHFLTHYVLGEERCMHQDPKKGEGCLTPLLDTSKSTQPSNQVLMFCSRKTGRFPWWLVQGQGGFSPDPWAEGRVEVMLSISGARCLSQSRCCHLL